MDVRIKVNGYTFRGSYLKVSYLHPFSVCLHLIIKICSYRSKFFYLRVDSFLEEFCLQVIIKEVTKMALLCKN